MASTQEPATSVASPSPGHIEPTEVPELKQRSWGDWAFPTSVDKATQAEVNMLHHHGVRTPHTRSVRNGIHTLHFEAPYEGERRHCSIVTSELLTCPGLLQVHQSSS